MAEDVFDQLEEVKGNWWKYETVGDEIKGTFINKRRQMNQLRGEEQWVYEVLTSEGDVYNVGGKPGIDNQMAHIKPGQYIKFVFIETRKPTKPGLNAAKIVQVYASPKLVNQVWIDEQSAAMTGPSEGVSAVDNSGIIPELADEATPEPGAPTTGAVEATEEEEPPFYSTVEEKKEAIIRIANKKLKIENPASLERQVMEATSLAFIDTNLDKIIDKLKEL